MLRILIADDHEIVRKGVRDVVEAHPGWEVCGEAGDGDSALSIALREKPDVAVLDVSLPVLNGVAVTRRLEISVKTVESHRAAAFRKAHARSAAELVRFAIKHNLIQP